MAKVKNVHVYGDAAKVERLRDEYEFLGRYCKIVEPGHLVVFARLPQKESSGKSTKRTKKEDRKEEKRPRKEHPSR